MIVPVPQRFEPFENLLVCSNMLVGVRVPVALDGVPVFLIGRGFDAPLVWIAARASRETSAVWGYVVHESQTEHDALAVRVDQRNRTITVTARPPSHAVAQAPLIVLRVRAADENSAVIDRLDLRPFGVSVFGDANGLSVGGTMWAQNQVEGPEVAWTFEGHAARLTIDSANSGHHTGMQSMRLPRRAAPGSPAPRTSPTHARPHSSPEPTSGSAHDLHPSEQGHSNVSPRGSLPASVVVCECWARDGLQSLPAVIPTDHKIEMIDRITAAGFRKVEVTSFSHPKLLPQFADAVEVLRRIVRRPGVSHLVLVPNERGFDRLEACQKEGYGADEMILMMSSSEKHNLLNFRTSHVDAMREHARMMRRAHGLGIRIVGCAGTVYGCPVVGDVPIRDVAKIVRFYLEEGAQTIMLADTTGMANPVLVRERIAALRWEFPRVEYIGHFHDTRGTGIVNTVAALELGLRYVDSSLGGLGGGGQPATGAAKYSAGFTGNTCTEDLVALLEEMGVRTGVDVERMINAGRLAEDVVGSGSAQTSFAPGL